MSTYTPPPDIAQITLAKSSDVNSISAATKTAFELLPNEDKLQQNRVTYDVATGAANTYALALTNINSYEDGLCISFRVVNSNTGASTINVNGKGAKSIKLINGEDVVAGDIIAGAPIQLTYSSSTGFFHVASNSANYAGIAKTQAINAANSASAAAGSASAASSSASAASSSASAASSSASAASGSASAASGSASAASGSASAASSSASAASSSASAASSSAAAASSSAASAAASYDSFDDRYLGTKSSDPSVDNDGNTLLVGAIYWNTTSSVIKIWTGSVWQNLVSLASNLSGGSADAIPYQTSANNTAFLANPSTAGLLLQSAGTGNPPTWSASAPLATNLSGGSADAIPYQTSANNTAFLANPATAGLFLQSAGAGNPPTWSSSSGSIGITDVSTNATHYINFTPASSGSTTTVDVASSGLTFNPSTKILKLAGVSFNFNSNYVIDVGALPVNTTGYGNVSLGSALQSNTTGYSNSVLGINNLMFNTTGNYNVAINEQVLMMNTTGTYNIGIGFEALMNNTTGSYNIAIGSSALLATGGTSSYNIGIGIGALASSSGSHNTAIGHSALGVNGSGTYNVAVGESALYSNGTGVSNTAIGYQALLASTGSGNTAVGNTSGLVITTGGSNTLLGNYAGGTVTTGSNNILLGDNAGSGITTGSSNIVINTGAEGLGSAVSFNVLIGASAGSYLQSNNNTAIGYGALSSSVITTSATPNTAIGMYALGSTSLTSAANNTGIGYACGVGLTTGTDNCFLGHSTGTTITTGTNNVSIGTGSNYGISTGSNNIGIGYQTNFTANTTSNNIAIGSSALNLATGGNNIAIGSSSGSAITTGANNVILGTYTGSAAPISATKSNFIVLSDGAGTVRNYFDNSGNSYTTGGVVWKYQPAATAKSAAATLTAAELATGIIRATGTTYTLTLPTATALDTANPNAQTNMAFDFSVVSSASGVVTVAVGTGITANGLLTLAANTSGLFRLQKTGTATYNLFRLS